MVSFKSRIHFIQCFVLSLLLFFGAYLKGQPVTPAMPPYTPAQLDNKVPDYLFTSLINYPRKTAPLSDFKSRLVILDFWTTTCGACISSWPKLVELQKQFKDQLQIIMIDNTESEATIRKTLEEKKRIFNVNINMPVVCKDSIIESLFPYSSVPYAVWIENGVFRFRTHGNSINAKNIQNILEGNAVTMPEYIDNNDLIIPQNNKPMFIDGNGGKLKSLMGRSILAKGDDRLFPGPGMIANEKGGYVALYTGSIRDMYLFAYANQGLVTGQKFAIPHPFKSLTLNRACLRMKDTTKYVNVINHEYFPNKNFSYQLISGRPVSIQQLLKKMRADLDMYTGLEAHWEKKIVPCLVLTAKDTLLIMDTTIHNNPINNSNIYFSTFKINGLSISEIILMLEYTLPSYYYSPYPIIDETNFKGLVGGINIETNVGDYQSLNKELKKYKMALTLQNREINILVISEPGYTENEKNK